METVKKVVKTNFFHDLGLQNGLSRGKSWPVQLSPLFPRISEEVFFSRKWWKKLARTPFSTMFMIPKTSSEIRGNSEKSCQNQLFPRFGPPKRLESWKKLARTTFSTISMIPKTSSELRGNSGKSCQNQRFPRFGPPKRLESWKKLVLTTFSPFSTNF